MHETVAILGASNETGRYSHKAKVALTEHGHITVLFNPNHDKIDGQKCFQSLAAYEGKIDTITVYVRPSILRGLVAEIIHARPERVILNPGTEDDAVVQMLKAAGIDVQIACTLVLLSSNQYMNSK